MFQKMIGEGVYSSIVNCKYLPDKEDRGKVEKVFIYSIFAYLMLLCMYPEVSLATDDLKTLITGAKTTVTGSVATAIFSMAAVYSFVMCIVASTIKPGMITVGAGLLYKGVLKLADGGFDVG